MLLFRPHQLRGALFRHVSWVLLLGAAAGAVQAEPAGRARLASVRSPLPEHLPLRVAWRVAESYAATIPDGDVMVGSGDSMLPLYPDHTVIVLQRMPMAALRAGMTVVFIGDRGRPVAHQLVAKTPRGWTAQGLANDDLDDTLVRANNYLGTVVKAYAPAPEGETRPVIAAGIPATGTAKVTPGASAG